MDSELLAVKWNDHRKTFFDVLATSREKKRFCDATIACEGNLYPVHRFVISTCSTYFEKILETINDAHPVIVLADVKPKLIEDLLQYMYTGEIKVLQEDIDSLIKAGEDLKIKGIGGIGVADENEKDKKKKRISNNNEERPQKRQRNDEYTESTKLKASTCKESQQRNEANQSAESLNESACQNVHDDSLDLSNLPVPEFTAVKEEILQINHDSSYFHDHGIKEEMCESAMEEVNMLATDCDEYDRSSDGALCHEYDSFTSNNYYDASTSSMSPAQKIHMEWIKENEHQGQAIANRKLALTGWCLVCGDRGSGYHYGIETCEGCKAFFKRSTRNNVGMDYYCSMGGDCVIIRGNRGTCKACRFKKCTMAGMKWEKIRPDRSRGGSTKRSDEEWRP